MKKFLLTFFICSILFHGLSFAQSPTKNTLPTSQDIEKINQQVDQLKNKVASRVAALKLVEKRGIMGSVESVSDTQITLTDLNGKTRLVDVDELTKFSSDSNNSFDISDVKKGSKISVLGLYNKESERLLARFINEVTIPVFLDGVVSDKNDEDFTITLSTQDGTSYIIDVENVTKTFSYQDGELQESGFSKIKSNANMIVIGFPDPKEKNRITASRVISFPDIPKNPNVPIIDVSPSPTPITNQKQVSQ